MTHKYPSVGRFLVDLFIFIMWETLFCSILQQINAFCCFSWKSETIDWSEEWRCVTSITGLACFFLKCFYFDKILIQNWIYFFPSMLELSKSLALLPNLRCHYSLSLSLLCTHTDKFLLVSFELLSFEVPFLLKFPHCNCQDFKIQNIVGSCDVKFPIRLEGLAYSHGAFSSVSKSHNLLNRGSIWPSGKRAALNSFTFMGLTA